jgi:hypothetical protein
MGRLAVHAEHCTPARLHGHFADLRTLLPWSIATAGKDADAMLRSLVWKHSVDFCGSEGDPIPKITGHG